MLRKHYAMLVAMYGYYSSLHGPDQFKFGMEDYRVLLQHFKLVNPEVEGLRQQDLEAVFGRVNPDLAEAEGVTSCVPPLHPPSDCRIASHLRSSEIENGIS